MAKKKKDAKKKSSMRDKAKRRAERNMNRGGAMYLDLPEGTEQFRPKKGTYSLDVIPYKVSVSNHPEAEKGELWYQRTIWVHFSINNKSYLCPRTINKPCPICEQVKDLYNSDDQADRKLAGDIKAKERELYNVIDLDDQDKGVQLFNISYHLFGKALDEEINEGKDEYGGFAELEDGKTLSVRFGEKSIGGGKPFVEATRIDFEDRDDYDEDILDDVVDLDSILVVESYENLQKALYETDDADEEDDDEDEDEDEEEEDETEKKKKNVKKSGKKSSKKNHDTTGKKKGKKSKESSRDSDDTDEDEEEEKDKKKKDKKKKSPKCPHGGTFGEDFDTLEDCDECKFWTECSEAADDEDEDE
jgi:hypothetical protein